MEGLIPPKIIKLDKRYITGMFGNIETQGELWAKVNECYDKNPFSKSDARFCHIYLWDTQDPERSVFFGYETDSAIECDEFATLEIPACEWAIFDLGHLMWDAPNSGEVINWIENNGAYSCGKYDGSVYQIEYYTTQASMEVWYPLDKKHK